MFIWRQLIKKLYIEIALSRNQLSIPERKLVSTFTCFLRTNCDINCWLPMCYIQRSMSVFRYVFGTTYTFAKFKRNH